MKIRLQINLHKELKEASLLNNIDIVDIFRKALRKYNRIGSVAELENIKLATGKTIPETVDINPDLIGGKDSNEIRKIICWYLSDQKKHKPTPLDIKQEIKSIQKDEKQLKKLALMLAKY